MFTMRWAAPAVYTPAGRSPAVRMAPLVRSRQPMVRITVLPCTVNSPFTGFTAVTVFSLVTDSTMVSVKVSISGLSSINFIHRPA